MRCPIDKPFVEGTQSLGVGHLAEIYTLLSKIDRGRIAEPMRAGAVRIVSGVKLNAAFGVHKHCSVSPEILGNHALKVVHSADPLIDSDDRQYNPKNAGVKIAIVERFCDGYHVTADANHE